MRTFLVFVSLLTLSFGCKDKPKRKTQAPPTAQQQGSGAEESVLLLPRADGTPPKKTTQPHTKEDYEKLAELEYPGFTRDVRVVGDKAMEVRHKTNDFPRLWATVTIQHCMDCVPMELDKWKAKTEELKTFLADPLKQAKEGVEFEVGQTELNGQPIIYHYQFGLVQGSDEGGMLTAFTNAFFAYYNDGVNQIRVVGEYKDDPTSAEHMKKLAPKQDLRALALAFLDVYTHAW